MEVLGGKDDCWHTKKGGEGEKKELQRVNW